MGSCAFNVAETDYQFLSNAQTLSLPLISASKLYFSLLSNIWLAALHLATYFSQLRCAVLCDLVCVNNFCNNNNKIIILTFNIFRNIDIPVICFLSVSSLFLSFIPQRFCNLKGAMVSVHKHTYILSGKSISVLVFTSKVNKRIKNKIHIKFHEQNKL